MEENARRIGTSVEVDAHVDYSLSCIVFAIELKSIIIVDLTKSQSTFNIWRDDARVMHMFSLCPVY